MAAERGRALVLKVGDGATSEAFTTIGGMRANTITINGETVDVTDKDSAGWRELLADAGVKSVSIAGSGIFKGTAAEATMRSNVLDQSLNNYRLQFQAGDYFAGSFQLVSLEYTGEYNGARQFSLQLESSGEVTYSAS